MTPLGRIREPHELNVVEKRLLWGGGGNGQRRFGGGKGSDPENSAYRPQTPCAVAKDLSGDPFPGEVNFHGEELFQTRKAVPIVQATAPETARGNYYPLYIIITCVSICTGIMRKRSPFLKLRLIYPSSGMSLTGRDINPDFPYRSAIFPPPWLFLSCILKS